MMKITSSFWRLSSRTIERLKILISSEDFEVMSILYKAAGWGSIFAILALIVTFLKQIIASSVRY